jgi:hypothetical protein
MLLKRLVKILYAIDGQYIFDRILDEFKNSPDVEVNDVTAGIMPQPFQTAVCVFILTEESKKDTRLAQKMNELRESHFKILPVVEDLKTYNFNNPPP